MNNILPNNHLAKNVKEWAEKKGISEKTVRRDFKELGLTKTREEYLNTAQERRKIVFDLRQQGLKFREIAEKLNISLPNAQMLCRRYNM